jgi:hypothetical protein
MSSNYHLDPSKIKLDRVKREIAGRKLSPKRQILGEQLDTRFDGLREAGIETLADLLAACKNRKAIAACTAATGIPEEYLTILGREARGYLPQPVDLRDIPDCDSESVAKLHKEGLGNSKKLWERLRSENAPTESDKGSGGLMDASRGVASELGIDPSVLVELWQLSDLARIPGVGPVFARLIYLSGYATCGELAEAVVDDLDRSLKEANAGNRYTSVMASRSDLAGCIKWARELAQGER